jgi:hypothetical protein
MKGVQRHHLTTPKSWFEGSQAPAEVGYHGGITSLEGAHFIPAAILTLAVALTLEGMEGFSRCGFLGPVCVGKLVFGI